MASHLLFSATTSLKTPQPAGSRVDMDLTLGWRCDCAKLGKKQHQSIPSNVDLIFSSCSFSSIIFNDVQGKGIVTLLLLVKMIYLDQSFSALALLAFWTR